MSGLDFDREQFEQLLDATADAVRYVEQELRECKDPDRRAFLEARLADHRVLNERIGEVWLRANKVPGQTVYYEQP